ncbi:MAG: adenosylcobinamide-GDP ribazoletransferase [Paracoccaceae bacterium]
MPENDMRRIQPADITEALGLLTRLSVRSRGARGVNAGWAWPLAGALVALIAGIAGWSLARIGLPVNLTAALIVAAMVVLTGAMHEDGLADCADGFWGGWTPERRLDIMKDSRIGTYGVVALVLALLARWSAIVGLIGAGAPLGPLVAAAALSRVPMLALMWSLPNARAGGLSDQTGKPDRDTVLLAGAVGLLIALIFAGFAAIPAAVAVAAVAWGATRLAQERIGGQTGDVLGATQQLGEIAGLAVFVTILG